MQTPCYGVRYTALTNNSIMVRGIAAFLYVRDAEEKFRRPEIQWKVLTDNFLIKDVIRQIITLTAVILHYSIISLGRKLLRSSFSYRRLREISGILLRAYS